MNSRDKTSNKLTKNPPDSVFFIREKTFAAKQEQKPVSVKTEFFGEKGIKSKISDIVIINIESFSKVTSPSYDLGQTKDDLVKKWKQYYN